MDVLDYANWDGEAYSKPNHGLGPELNGEEKAGWAQAFITLLPWCAWNATGHCSSHHTLCHDRLFLLDLCAKRNPSLSCFYQIFSGFKKTSNYSFHLPTIIMDEECHTLCKSSYIHWLTPAIAIMWWKVFKSLFNLLYFYWLISICFISQERGMFKFSRCGFVYFSFCFCPFVLYIFWNSAIILIFYGKTRDLG